METSIGELHQNSGGAKIEMLRQEVIPSFRAAQAVVVGVSGGRLLVNGTT